MGTDCQDRIEPTALPGPYRLVIVTTTRAKAEWARKYTVRHVVLLKPE
jgi:hypothetical protein